MGYTIPCFRSFFLLSTAVFSITVLSLPSPIHAATRTILAEAVYVMGDGETPTFAEAMCFQKAKQAALEQAGTYVESYTKVRNLDLTAEEIQTIAGGIVQVDILERKRATVGEGFQFLIKIKATVTTDNMEELARRVRGRNVAEEYKQLQSDYSRLEREVTSLKELLARPRIQDDDRQIAQDRLRDQEKALSTIQRQEGVFFERLLSGKDLYARAEQQLTEKKLRARNQRATAEAIYQEIVERGHEITIGDPEIETHLGDQGKADLTFPVSIKPNPSVRAKVGDARKSFGESFGYADYRRLEKQLENLSFVLEIVSKTGSTYICNVPRHVSLYQGDGEFIDVGTGPNNYNVRITVPLIAIREMTSVRGKFADSAPGNSCGITTLK
jgi:hypothetical protein